MFEKQKDIGFLFRCDRRACEVCMSEDCSLTDDPTHAADFRRDAKGTMVQVFDQTEGWIWPQEGGEV